jgi:hypothetical protein
MLRILVFWDVTLSFTLVPDVLKEPLEGKGTAVLGNVAIH